MSLPYAPSGKDSGWGVGEALARWPSASTSVTDSVHNASPSSLTLYTLAQVWAGLSSSGSFIPVYAVSLLSWGTSPLSPTPQCLRPFPEQSLYISNNNSWKFPILGA